MEIFIYKQKHFLLPIYLAVMGCPMIIMVYIIAMQCPVPPRQKKNSIQKKMLTIQIVWRKSAEKAFKETPFQTKRFGGVRSHRFEKFIVKFSLFS